MGQSHWDTRFLPKEPRHSIRSTNGSLWFERHEIMNAQVVRAGGFGYSKERDKCALSFVCKNKPCTIIHGLPIHHPSTLIYDCVRTSLVGRVNWVPPLSHSEAQFRNSYPIENEHVELPMVALRSCSDPNTSSTQFRFHVEESRQNGETILQWRIHKLFLLSVDMNPTFELCFKFGRSIRIASSTQFGFLDE